MPPGGPCVARGAHGAAAPSDLPREDVVPRREDEILGTIRAVLRLWFGALSKPVFGTILRTGFRTFFT